MTADHLLILKALDEIPFGVGKKLLHAFLNGDETNDSIKRNRLYNYPSFGSLLYSRHEMEPVLSRLIMNKLVAQAAVQGKPHWKVLELTPLGREELKNPTLQDKQHDFSGAESSTQITDEERQIFSALPHLSTYNDLQKKSIICANPKILCIAGAGSGKTTVLTQRIAFLTQYRSVAPQNILAITFTKKARAEMLSRIENKQVNVQTFNSFCEGILRAHNDLVYTRDTRVLSYRDKIVMIRKGLESLNLSIGQAIRTYFTWGQRRGKTEEKLARIFTSDIFYLRDYFKSKNMEITEDAFEVDQEHEKAFRMVVGVANYVEAYMKKHGLRDFSDQLLDALSLFKSHPETIPRYDHILIDEYQDINATQIELIDALNPEHLFCVGDPRQSIFGWRGSDITFILNFKEKYPEAEVTTLTKNYRSSKEIVTLVNTFIKHMGLADLEAHVEERADVEIKKLPSQNAEFHYIIEAIKHSKLPRNEIFVLSRTNRPLQDLSQLMKQQGIRHVTRTDEGREVAGPDDVVLSTIHAIKGMEADTVFVMGCTPNNFPCRGSDHPVMDLVKVNEYDKEEEEKRLLYVAMSRAKSTLKLTYTTSKTYFLTSEVNKLLGDKKRSLFATPVASSNEAVERLKAWRLETSRNSMLKPYMIFNDRTLHAIAAQQPQTEEDLQRIHGMGPSRVYKYGKDILEILQG